MKTTSSSMTESIRVVATAIFDEEYTELSDGRSYIYYNLHP